MSAYNDVEYFTIIYFLLYRPGSSFHTPPGGRLNGCWWNTGRCCVGSSSPPPHPCYPVKHTHTSLKDTWLKNKWNSQMWQNRVVSLEHCLERENKQQMLKKFQPSLVLCFLHWTLTSPWFPWFQWRLCQRQQDSAERQEQGIPWRKQASWSLPCEST